MARGEASKERSTVSGVSIFLAFLAVLLLATTLVMLVVRDVQRVAAPPRAEPFVGAAAAFQKLFWRDAARVHAVAGPTIGSDAAYARALLEGTLRLRGYIPAPARGLAPLVRLPGEFVVDAFDGGCGLVVLVADGSSTLVSADVEGERFLAHDPSIMAVPGCGVSRVRVEGTGSFAAHAWLLPGLTPTLAEAIGLPVDALLAHAEAEALLSGSGLEATDQIFEVEVRAGAARVAVPVGIAVASGCVPFVAVALGAGDVMGDWVLADATADRALFGIAACARRTDGIPTLSVPSGVARVFLRPYGPSRSGSARGVRPSAMRLVAPHDVDISGLALAEGNP